MLLKENYITRGFWGDEAWTVGISRLPIPELVQVTGQDFHPPLYYLLVHGFIKVFGPSEWVRSISTFFWLLALWPTYQLAKKISNAAVARLATLLVALSPILFTYAFEARAYALLTFLSVYSTLLFWQALNQPKLAKKTTSFTSNKSWILYVIVGALGVYTHYYMWFILAAHGLYWLLINRGQFKRVFLSYLAIVIAQLPWIPVLLSQLQSVKGSYWIGQINERTHWEFLMRIIAGDFTTDWQGYWTLAVLAVMVLGIPFVAMKHRANKQSGWLPAGYVLLWFWLIIPVVLPTVLSFVYRPVFFYRYLVFSSVPILMITIWNLWAMHRKVLWVGVILMLLMALSTNWLIFNRAPYSMREELTKVFGSSTPPSEDVRIKTYLGSFAEVYYYVGQRAPVVVSPEGLVQFSGQSLLNKYVEKGLVTVEETQPGETYWQVGPEKSSRLFTE